MYKSLEKLLYAVYQSVHVDGIKNLPATSNVYMYMYMYMYVYLKYSHTTITRLNNHHVTAAI